MAIITTPGAGVSPYQSSDTDPTVLRAAADGTTVLANATTADATGPNTSVYVAGQAAVNSLITSGQSGVFQGANVNITLEEQNFNTTNQVTSTINYASGAAGSIQYNNGANGFAGSDYFTYTSGNVVTPGIRTDGYFYSNGAPFIGGGNAAIGNFVFTGDTMSISDSNQNMNITGNGTGNIQVNSNSNVWVFNNDGNLTLPSNSSSINYANGSPYGSGSNYSNSNVSSFLAAFGSNVVSTTGNITGGNLTTTGTANVASLAVTGSVTVQGSIGVSSWITVSSDLSANGNILTGNNISAAGNVTGNYFIGNGSQLTGISTSLPLANGTSNIDIATANGNVTITANGSPTWTFESDGNLSLPTAGNIVGAVNIIGNGTSNVNVIANSRAWTFAADGNLVLPLAGNIVNYGNTWNFGYNGILTLPGNSRVAPVGANIEIQAAAGGYAEIVTSDGNSYVSVTTSGAQIVTSGVYSWNFNNVGNLTLPGNTFAVNYANGNPVSIANTGNVTFSSEIVIGTGTSNLISGLYLAPSSSSANANMYLRVRGNIVDEPTHIHFDTGNNQYYNQFIGDDNKYIQLANTGNIVINSNDAAGNSAQWTFGTDGNLTIPGNIIGANVVSANAFTNLTGAGNVLIQSSENQTGPIATWTFDPVSDGTGNTVFPTGMHITSDGAGGTRMSQNSDTSNIALRISAGNTNAFSSIGWSLDEIPGTGPVAVIAFNLPVSRNNAQIVTGNLSATNYRWTFNDSGITILPNGAVIKDTSGGSLAIGVGAGALALGNTAVAVGYQAAFLAQGNNSVAIGTSAGETQGEQAVAIGLNAGRSQGNYAVAIGKFSANSSQGEYSVAIGPNAGFENQLSNAVSIGSQAGASSQGINSVAVGVSAAYNTQGNNAVAIGNSAAYLLQGYNSVAIGVNAGIYYLGNSSIAIGANAGNNLQGDNSIVFNATGSNLRNTTANTFTVKPVRGDSTANLVGGGFKAVYYNSSTGEFAYSTD